MILLVAAAAAGGAETAPSTSQPAPRAVTVRIEKVDSGWRLTRGGRPYLIQGAGGQQGLPALAAAGGNSIRTWGGDVDSLLDEAHKLGLTVTVGIWLGQPRQGFRYDNPQSVASQARRAEEIIERHRDHPAVLMWGLGNEMEGDGEDPAIWRAVNDLAVAAKRIDPNHPTMTVIAELGAGGRKIANLHCHCPAIDVVGINSYAGLPSLPKRYRDAGGAKPYVITEFGPQGHWEVAKTAFGLPIEATSTAKAEHYRAGYEAAVTGSGGLCVGSYVFLWGHKQEATPTWYGMFLTDGSRLGAVDAMTELWSGKPPANRAPRLRSIKLDAVGRMLRAGSEAAVAIEADDPDGDELTVKWAIGEANLGTGLGGEAEQALPTREGAVLKAGKDRMTFRVPEAPGAYRAFAVVRDGHGAAAVGNVPFYVPDPTGGRGWSGARARLPLVLYGDGAGATPPYAPSGWMGNNEAVKMDEKCKTSPHGGPTCLEVRYEAANGWAGVVWQSPPNDWGNEPGGWDVTGAEALTFWARGEQGGERVSFKLGLLDRDKRYYDTTVASLGPLRLTTDWKEYRIELGDRDLRRIKTGFCWIVGGQGKNVVFYLDDIRYVPPAPQTRPASE